jgi:hypothetical protein
VLLNDTHKKLIQKIMKKVIFLICPIFLFFNAKAQSTWYFGDHAGIKFTGGVAANAIGSGMSTGEGCAGLVDANNNVMMYTDGDTIWNGAHQKQNSLNAGNLLKGNSSSTQTALIVPIPSATILAGPVTKAFIFTVAQAEKAYGNDDNTNRGGLRVTLVSITGTAPATIVTIAATDYNIRLTPGSSLMGEKLTVTPDGVGGYWVLTHGVGVSLKVN